MLSYEFLRILAGIVLSWTSVSFFTSVISRISVTETSASSISSAGQLLTQHHHYLLPRPPSPPKSAPNSEERPNTSWRSPTARWATSEDFKMDMSWSICPQRRIASRWSGGGFWTFGSSVGCFLQRVPDRCCWVTPWLLLRFRGF